MALEAGDGFISGLVSTNPVNATDQVAQGDDHIRLIKTALLGTFPNLNGAVTPSPAELNILDTANTFDLNHATADLDGTTFTANYTTLTLTGGSAVVTLAGTEIDLTATTLDFNGAADLSGNLTIGGQILSTSQTVDADNLAYQPRLSVTTLTSYGWTAQSAISGYISC